MTTKRQSQRDPVPQALRALWETLDAKQQRQLRKAVASRVLTRSLSIDIETLELESETL